MCNSALNVFVYKFLCGHNVFKFLNISLCLGYIYLMTNDGIYICFSNFHVFFVEIDNTFLFGFVF